MTCMRQLTEGIAKMTTTKTITVPANPDLDDCLQGAVDAYVAEHPEARGWDLSPRWADETRETIELDVPVLPAISAEELRRASGTADLGGGNAVEDCDALYDR